MPKCIGNCKERVVGVGSRTLCQSLSKPNMLGCSHCTKCRLLSCKTTVYVVIFGSESTKKHEQKNARVEPLAAQA